MKAKDTVTQSRWPLTYEEYLKDKLAQAEISFKAGVEEVVEFMEDRLERYKVAPYLLGFTMLSEDWQSAKKEWGL